MTDQQFQDWLKIDGAIRVVLIEAVAQIDGVETPIYLSTEGYNTAPGDVPANTHYQPIATVGTLFTEELSLTGDGALSAGDIEIDNYAGERDEWTSYTWMNRPIKAYMGDVRWPRSDFQLIFNGIVADIAPSGSEKLLLKLRDKLQRLDTPITEATIGGTGPNAESLVPFLVGECHNVEPPLTDPATLERQVNGGSVQRIIEVRDQGVPVSVTLDEAHGKFKLNQASKGQITASVQGMNQGGYKSTIAQLVQLLVTQYGKESDRFTNDDLDLANLAAFDAAHPQPVGYYANSRTNVLVAANALASSVGAQLSMSRTGQLRLIQIALPDPAGATEIRLQDMEGDSLEPTGRTSVVAAVVLGYAKNWTPEPDLATSIPDEHKALYAKEWLEAKQSDDQVVADCRLNTEPVLTESMLLRKVDADPEAQRRRDLWKSPAMLYEFDGKPHLLSLRLGQSIRVYHPRYGMKNGVLALVTKLGPDWRTGQVRVGFVVFGKGASASAVAPAPLAAGAIANDRDVLLQGAVTRTVTAKGAAVIVTPDSSFHIAADGSHTPAKIKVTAALVMCDGPITFSAQGATLTNVTATTAEIAFADMPGVSAIITATANNGGQPVSGSRILATTVDGQPGANGQRGAGLFYAAGSSWSDVVAQMTAPGGPVVGDQVTISDGVSFTLTKRWTGTQWVVPGAYLNGSLFVDGGIIASKIDTRGLSIKDAAGNVILAAGGALPLAYAPAGTLNSDLMPMTGSGVAISGNTITKTAGTSAWDAGAVSIESFAGGAFVSVVSYHNDHPVMFGLNTDPFTDYGYGSIDYAIYLREDGKYSVYESGVSPPVDYIGTYAKGDVFAVSYDGIAIRYSRNGVIFRTVIVVITAPLFFDSSMYYPGTVLANVRFGPMTSTADAAQTAKIGGITGASGEQIPGGAVLGSILVALGKDRIGETASGRADYVADAGATGGYAYRVWQGWTGLMKLNNATKALIQLPGLVQGKNYRVIVRTRKVGAPTSAPLGVYNGTAGAYPFPGVDYIGSLTTSWKTIDLGVITPNWADGDDVFVYLGTDPMSAAPGPANSVLIDWIAFQSVNAADGATVGATIGANLNGQITPANASTYIASAAIASAMVADLRTSNYGEDASGNPTAGAKLASTGIALKVANNGLQVGTAVFSDYWFRLVQGIDGSVSAGKVIWRGNNDVTTRGGAPNIACLSVTPKASQVINSNFQQVYHAYKLTPTSYTAYTDNLDAMEQIHVQFFATSSSSAPFTELYQRCPSRTYDGAAGIVQGSWAWGWRFGGTGAVTGAQYETNGVYTGYLRVRLQNSYGWSATQDFAPGSSIDTPLATTTITGSGGSGGGGSGGVGGQCPAAWVKVCLINGREVNAGELHTGARLAAVNDDTLEALPDGGVVRDLAIIWAQRYRVKLADGSATEWSADHRFAVKQRGWVKVQHLHPGDRILALKEAIVESVLAVGQGQVVSFRVEGAGTYFGGGLLCHNTKQLP